MSRKLTRALLLLFLVLPFRVPAQTSAAPPLAPQTQSALGQKIQIPGIPNAGKISDSLYHGAQPKIPAMEELRKLGVTTIVDLRSESPSLRKREKAEAEKLGIRFLSVPVGGFSPPTNDQVAHFLSLFAGNSSEKVFVHCHRGEDRTGVFVAAYRMAIEKWSVEQAVHEMYFFGFNGRWQPRMKSFIRGFPARLQSAPAFAAFQQPSH